MQTTSEKPTNPKDAVGIKKVPMSCVSAPFMAGVGAAMMEGALKYGRHNYREAGVRSSVYYDAAMRHLMAWWEGEDVDPESGLPHVLKAAACMAVVYDSMHYGNLNDDRPPPHKDGWQSQFNSVAEQLMAKYPVPKAAHVRKGDDIVRQAEVDLYEQLKKAGAAAMPPQQSITATKPQDYHLGETPTHYSTEEGGTWNAWPQMEGSKARFGYFAKKYANGDIFDLVVGWR